MVDTEHYEILSVEYKKINGKLCRVTKRQPKKNVVDICLDGGFFPVLGVSTVYEMVDGGGK